MEFQEIISRLSIQEKANLAAQLTTAAMSTLPSRESDSDIDKAEALGQAYNIFGELLILLESGHDPRRNTHILKLAELQRLNPDNS